MRWWRQVLVLAVLASPACIQDEVGRACAEAMRDAAGVEYPTDDRQCIPAIDDDSPVGFYPDGSCGQGGNEPGLVFTWGRFYEVCSACGPAFFGELCRPLVCEVDEECPRFGNERFVDGEREPFTENFECRNGVCQSDDLESHPPEIVYSSEAAMLCLAPLPRRAEYEGPDPCPGVPFDSTEACPLPLPAACLQP